MIYFSILILILLAWVLSVFISLSNDIEDGLFVAIFGVIPVAIFLLPWFISYSSHADDIATLQEQHRIITVYHDRIESLGERLDKIAKTGVQSNSLLQMNADTPIGSIVNSITSFEGKIAEAEEKRAKAYQSIAARKIGLTKSVTWFFDEPEQGK